MYLKNGVGKQVLRNAITVCNSLRGDTSYVSTMNEDVVATYDEDNQEVDISLYGEHFQTIFLDEQYDMLYAARTFLRLVEESEKK
jgi:hypothetical protein